ncbi:enoyl-CoA hydratase-related protein [Shewanella sp. ULN5]|uniref:enoyl-CoA hydratase/isomerase family protein n=1 Tax=Shewanella sp. ULN5 TaxID=2994678 RepID=UPI00273DBB7D|nr:enoyl-CoA hydratase-related protein [Shewanella sp. ULN5]MDP5148297.1 enoyl-CoA hydratase-related protein [Shewanella sp. ULN5]
MTYQKLRVEIANNVATVFLVNPPMNVMTLDMRRELDEVLTNLEADPEVAVLVLTGDGDRSFGTGSDIQEFPGLLADGAVVSRKLAPENETFTKFANFPKPTVAAIEGFALGGGMELAAGADIIVVGENARFGLPEIKLGALPGSGGTVRITRRIGIGRVSELMLLGDMVDAQQVLAWGYANRIAPKGEVLAHAHEFAAKLAKGPKQAMCACKQALRYGMYLPEEQAIAKLLGVIDVLSRTNDLHEGADAFINKRTPDFKDPLDTSKFVGCIFPK